MTPENFCYWLQGMLEISGAESLSKEQLAIIKEHLGYVFDKPVPKEAASTIPIPRDPFKRLC